MGALHLDIDTNGDVFALYFVTERLDSETRLQWELLQTRDFRSQELAAFEQLFNFLESRFKALEQIKTTRIGFNGQQQRPSTSQANYNSSNSKQAFHAVDLKCEFCSENHKLCFCKEFVKEEVDARRDFVLKNRICFNCLGNHSVRFCQKPTSCRICNKKHHSLLHPQAVSLSNNEATEKTTQSVNVAEIEVQTSDVEEVVEEVNTFTSRLTSGMRQTQVLLATALVRAESRTGELQMLRALLDQG